MLSENNVSEFECVCMHKTTPKCKGCFKLINRLKMQLLSLYDRLEMASFCTSAGKWRIKFDGYTHYIEGTHIQTKQYSEVETNCMFRFLENKNPESFRMIAEEMQEKINLQFRKIIIFEKTRLKIACTRELHMGADFDDQYFLSGKHLSDLAPLFHKKTPK